MLRTYPRTASATGGGGGGSASAAAALLDPVLFMASDFLQPRSRRGQKREKTKAEHAGQPIIVVK